MKYIVLVAMCMFASAAGAQTSPPASAEPRIPAYRARLLGVYDSMSGDAVEGADVTSVLEGMTMRTSSSGAIPLVILPEGGGLVRIRKVGYEVQTLMVSISPEDTLPVTVLLKRITELAAIVITDSAPVYSSSRLREFEERRRHQVSGSFIAEATLRHDEGRTLANELVARIPGAVVREGRRNQAYLLRSPRCGAGGNPAIFVDGVLMSPNPGEPGVNLGELQLGDYAGIEYYANNSNAPAQFGATLQSCGMLLLWSREK